MNFLEEIAELHQEEWGHLDRSITLERRINMLEKTANQRGIPSIYIALESDEFIGSAALVEQDMSTHHPELSPWLAAVFVKSAWRRQGIASRLVRFCEDKAIEEKVEKLYLFTELASRLYSTLGWQVLESCNFNGVRVHVMYKELAS